MSAALLTVFATDSVARVTLHLPAIGVIPLPHNAREMTVKLVLYRASLYCILSQDTSISASDEDTFETIPPLPFFHVPLSFSLSRFFPSLLYT
jgi:hypothetical protein